MSKIAQVFRYRIPIRIETENAKVANFEFPPPQLIQATFSEGISEYGI